MAELVTVTGDFGIADDSPAEGRVWFGPWLDAVLVDPDPVLVTKARVEERLDESGAFSVELIGSHDPAWQTDGPVPYLVRWAVSGSYAERVFLIPDGAGPFDLFTLVDLKEPPTIVPTPVPGPPGPTAVSGDPGNAATLGTDNLLYVPPLAGITDHGDLTGLGDDDHPQYLTPARGDVRYAPAGSGVTDHGALTGLDDPDHPIGAVQGLQAALDGKAALSHSHGLGDLPDTLATDAEVAAAISAHTAAPDPHPQYLSSAEGSAAGSALGPVAGVAPVTVITGVDSGWAKADAGGSFTHDTTVFKTGTASGKITCPNTAAPAAPQITFGANQDWTGQGFGMWVRSDDWANVTDGYLLVGTGAAGFGSYFIMQWRPKVQRPANNEWAWFPFGPGDFTVGAGTPTWAQARQLLFRVYGTNGTTPSVWIDTFDRYPQPGRGTVSITFDDGFASDYLVAKPKLDQYGFRATHYIMPTAIGTPAYLTQNQVDELADKGDDIAGHGVNDLTTMAFADAVADATNTRQWLAERGYKGQDHYALPLGGHTQALDRVLRGLYRTVRGTSTFGQSLNRPNPANLMGQLPGQVHSAATINAWITRAATNREWLILSFHKILTTPVTDEDVSTTVFNAVIDHLATVDVDVLPISDAAMQALNTRVVGSGVTTVARVTQAQYDALTPPVPTTLYVIVG